MVLTKINRSFLYMYHVFPQERILLCINSGLLQQTTSFSLVHVLLPFCQLSMSFYVFPG